MKVTAYLRPHGDTCEIDMDNMLPEDEEYFIQHKVKISVEDLGEQFVVYADTGAVNKDGEPDELIELSRGRDCAETLSSLRGRCQRRIEGRDMEPELFLICESMDNAILRAAYLWDDDTREALKKYIARWTKAIKQHEAGTKEMS